MNDAHEAVRERRDAHPLATPREAIDDLLAAHALLNRRVVSQADVNRARLRVLAAIAVLRRMEVER